jgi:hypothetical protein
LEILWPVLLLGALSACDMFVPVPMPAPSSIPAFHPTATPTATPRPTSTPRATLTPSPKPYLTPTYAPCDHASLVSEDISPALTFLAPGAPFTQTWRVRNDSLCTWTPGYWLVKAGGHDLGGPLSLRIPYLVFPGAQLNLSVDMVAPCEAGVYYSYWMLQDEGGANFGIISSGRLKPLVAHINVAGTAVKPTCAGAHPVK